MRELNEHDVPCGPILDMREIAEEQALRETGTVVEVDHPKRGKFLTVGNPIKLSDSPTDVKRSPFLGEHTGEILRSILGLDDDEDRRGAKRGRYLSSFRIQKIMRHGRGIDEQECIARTDRHRCCQTAAALYRRQRRQWLCDAYGIPTPKQGFAKTATEAVKIATRLRFPVALKIVSDDILHKTEAGGVIVGLATAGEVRRAFDRLVKNAKGYRKNAQHSRRAGAADGERRPRSHGGRGHRSKLRQNGCFRSRRCPGGGDERHHLSSGAQSARKTRYRCSIPSAARSCSMACAAERVSTARRWPISSSKFRSW